MAQPTNQDRVLPPDLLCGDAPDITRTQIDWVQTTSLPQYADLYAVVLDNVLTAAECEALVRAAEATTGGVWEGALVNVGNGKQKMYKETRRSERIMWDSPELVERLWRRVAPSVPELRHLSRDTPPWNGATKRDTRYRFTRLNERMRFLKYGPGDYFRPHCDGAYVTPDGSEVSLFTFHLYLNDSIDGLEPLDLNPTKPSHPIDFIDLSDPIDPVVDDDPTATADRATVENDKAHSAEAAKADLRGGATTFHSWNMRDRYDVHPKAGRVLIFQHRGLVHSGDDVLAGTKLTMRTDLMYQKE